MQQRDKREMQLSRSDSMELLDCLQSNYIDLSPTCVNKLNRYKSSNPKRVN